MTTDTLGLSPKALQFATEQPRLWEYRLFGQVIIDEIERVKNIFKQGHLVHSSTIEKIVASPSLLEWIGKKKRRANRYFEPTRFFGQFKSCRRLWTTRSSRKC